LSLMSQNAPVPASVLAGCFLLISILLLASTVEVTLHYLRYDAMRLTLTGEPPAVGKRLDGVLDLPASAPAAWIGIELACVHVGNDRIGAKRAVAIEKDRWSERRQFPVRRSGRRASAVIRFDIPDSLPPSSGMPAVDASASLTSDCELSIWELRVGAGGAVPKLWRTLVVHVLPPANSFGHAGPQTH